MLTRLCTFFALLAASVQVFAEDIDLSRCEKSLYSQNGEDGVIQNIFQLIAPASRFCVDLGAYDGITGSNVVLFRLQQWDSLSLDRMHATPEYNLFQEFITAENVNKLFDKYHVPSNLDFLNISIDYNDFYIWKALDEKYQPALVVIGFNANHLPSEDLVVKYRPFYCGDGTDYFGASLRALYNLGRSKGYSLVYAEKSGAHLFFIRDDLLEEKNLKFANMNDIEGIYGNIAFASGAHRKDGKNRPYVSSASLLQAN